MQKLTLEQDARFAELAKPYLRNADVQSMGAFIQHGNVTTLEHVVRVARCAYAWAELRNLDVNEKDLVAGAILHDFYLYDWHERPHPPHHATKHPVYAAENAQKVFDSSPEVLAIVRSHMWPLPPTRVPRSREALLVCVADKYCSLYETLFLRSKKPCKSIDSSDSGKSYDSFEPDSGSPLVQSGRQHNDI